MTKTCKSCERKDKEIAHLKGEIEMFQWSANLAKDLVLKLLDKFQKEHKHV